MLIELNNEIHGRDVLIDSQGIPSEIIPSALSIVLDGNIAPEDDVDLYQLSIEAGEGITLDIDTIFDSDLDSLLRLFDEEGNELARSDDTPAPGEVFTLDPYLTFIAETSGDYYLGVSNVVNSQYDPLAIDRDELDLPGNINNSYQLEINLVEIVLDEDADDTIAEAVPIEFEPQERSATISGEIDAGRDIDIYQVSLKAGEGLILDIDGAEIGSSLDSQLRLFDAEGNQLGENDDTPDLDEELTTDSYLTYTAEVDGEYYIGVSTAGNASYDAIYGRTNLLLTESDNSGDYQLNVALVDLAADSDPDNTIAEANFVEPIIEGEAEGAIAIADSIEVRGDTDIFEFYLDEGETVTLNINAAKLNTGLDSALILFDEEGNELGRNDDDAAPGEISTTVDSYLEFTANTAGNYYAGVSGFPNVEYDVVNGSNNLGLEGEESFSIGDYELIINSFHNIEGTPEADTLFGYAQSTLIQTFQGDDSLTGGGDEDYFLGGSGNDFLSGNNGDDTLIGDSGFDTLSGGAGADILQGDNGDNQLYGGEGDDIFVLNELYPLAEDTILDFEDGRDKILLSNNSSFAELKIEELTTEIGISISTLEDFPIAKIIGIDRDSFSEEDLIVSLDSSAIE